MQAKEFLRRFLSNAIVQLGVSAGLRKTVPKKGAVILFGHRVSDDDEGFLRGLCPSWFAYQIEYLTRHYEVISLSDLVSAFEIGVAVPDNSVVLTFDDGFRDNLENVAPVLERHRIPATIFLVTGSVSSGQLPWPQRLGVLFQCTKAECLEHELLGKMPVDLRGRRRRGRTYLTLKESLKALPRVEREGYLEKLSELLEVEAPRDRMLSWGDVRAMKASGIEFGAHTFSHPLLAEIPREEARWEMEESRDDLREKVGIAHPSFCFPGGSYDGELVEIAKGLGFRSLFQSKPGLRVNNPSTTHQFALSRVGLPNAPAYILEAELDGPFHSIRKLFQR